MASAFDDNINELITRNLTGEASAAEELELRRWVDLQPENEEYYRKLQKAFEATTAHLGGGGSPSPAVDVDMEWRRFQENIQARKKTRTLSPFGMGLRIAAAIAFLVAATAVVLLLLRPGTTVVQTANNTETITLPDGSQVTLNHNSSLSYEGDYGDDTRTVALKGEAFFDVQANKSSPFLILTEGALIRVVGTTFNVNAYDSLGTVEVIVETGIVSLSPATGGQPAEILPGERGVIAKKDASMSISVNEDVNFRAWNTRHLVFVDADLLSVIRTLEKTYNAEILIKGEIPSSCILTVTFDRQPLESVMRVLENTLNLTYTIKGRRVEITNAGC